MRHGRDAAQLEVQRIIDVSDGSCRVSMSIPISWVRLDSFDHAGPMSLRIEDLNPEVKMRCALTRWELFKLALRMAFVAISSPALFRPWR